jgi:hypothetical protein
LSILGGLVAPVSTGGFGGKHRQLNLDSTQPQEYMFDFEAVLGGNRDVLVRVALRVNDGCRACRLVSN